MVNVGFWNVRTMFQTGKVKEIANEFKKYELSILGINDCRWSGSGKMRLVTGKTVLYSGKDSEHVSGVALLLDELVSKKCLIEWKPVSDRILSARFDSKFAKSTVVLCYTPTNNAEETEKEKFYEQLQMTVSGMTS